MKCFYCGSDDHPWFNCRKKPEGWKPPRSREIAGSNPAACRVSDSVGKLVKPPELSKPRAVNMAAPIPKPRGRPRTGFDKKAYDKERMKKARAALKAKRNG